MNIVLFISAFLLLIILLIISFVIVKRLRPIVGGCSGTRYGCCPDEITPKYNPHGTNCRPGPRPHPRPGPRPHPSPHPRPSKQHMIGGCSGTRYGCCPGSSIASNKNGSNC